MSYDIDPQIAGWEGEGGAEPRLPETVIDAAEQLIARGITNRALNDWATEATDGTTPPEQLL